MKNEILAGMIAFISTITALILMSIGEEIGLLAGGALFFLGIILTLNFYKSSDDGQVNYQRTSGGILSGIRKAFGFITVMLLLITILQLSADSLMFLVTGLAGIAALFITLILWIVESTRSKY